MGAIDRLKSWWESRTARRRFCTKSRLPFFDLAGQFLPRNADAIVMDIGPGDATFARHLGLAGRFGNFFLLDGNAETVKALGAAFPNVLLYRAPDRLPFQPEAVSYVHCSHLIEHLDHADLYAFLVEIDRVLGNEGILVISSPLMTDRFYYNLSHVKPYPPEVITRYLCNGQAAAQCSAPPISRRYVQESLVYQYASREIGEGLGGRSVAMDFLVKAAMAAASYVGVCRYVRAGYTLALRKRGLGRECQAEGVR